MCVCVCRTNSDSEWVSGIRFLQGWDAHEDMDKGGSSSACLYSRHSQNAALGTWYRISFLVHASAPSPSSPQNHEPQRFDSVIEESEDTQKDRQNSKEEENHRNRVRGQQDNWVCITAGVCECRSVCDKRRSVCNRIELHYNLLRDAK